LQTDWVNGGRLDLILDAVKAKTDNLPTDPADASDIAADFDRHLTPLIFWGDPEDTIQLTSSGAVKALPTITIPALPTGASIWKVQLVGFISAITSTHTSDNAVNGAASIQVRVQTTGSWTTGYDIQDNAFFVDQSQGNQRGGVPIVGNLNNDDLSGEVTGAGTYEVQITSIACDGGALDLYDLQFGLKVWIY